MAQRQLVPTALRDELTEYSSLLRALRTTHTLDVGAHLLQSQDLSDHESDSSEPEATPSTSSGPNGNKRKRPPTESEAPHWRKRDQWTRWPIPAKDVPPPDWSLQDEIGTIMKQTLASVEPESDSDSKSPSAKDESDTGSLHDSDSDNEDAYIQNLAGLITPVVENYLESVFALICAHTIARSDSMQNRIEPFDWRDLVNILGSPAAAHLVDETILQNVIARMQTLFETTPASTSTSIPAPSPDTVLHRHRIVQTSRSRLNNLLSKHTTSLFEQPPPPNQDYLTIRQAATKRKMLLGKRRKPRTRSEKAAVGAETRDAPTTAGKEPSVDQGSESEGSNWTDSDDER